MEETNKTKATKKEMVNPLRAEKVQVRFIPRVGGIEGDDPKHVASGGMLEGVTRDYCLPIIPSTGNYKNPLTGAEKEFLEQAMNMDYNALSVYSKFWDTFYVIIGKDGITLDLSVPEDYLKYKVLLCNVEKIAPSVEAMQDKPKSTYEYVLVRDEEESSLENAKMNATMASYKEFGKIENDMDTMRVLIEILDAKPYAVNSPKSALTSRINQLIQADAKMFLRTIQDPMLHTKVIIRRATELGKLSKRGDYYYLRSDNSPLCDPGEDPTLSIAARWLNQPSHSDVKALLESEVDNAKQK